MIHVTQNGTKYTAGHVEVHGFGDELRVSMYDVRLIDGSNVQAEQIAFTADEAPTVEPTEPNYARVRAPAPRPNF